MKVKKVAELPKTVEGLRGVIERAQAGDTQAVKELERGLAHEPKMFVKIAGGDLYERLVDKIHSTTFARSNPLFDAGVSEHMGIMREELLKGGSSFVEQMVVDALLASQLQWTTTGVLVGCAETFKQMDHYDRRHDRAYRRMMLACRTLASLRRVDVSAILANITQQGESNQVNVAVKL